jgi:hypothetical protein
VTTEAGGGVPGGELREIIARGVHSAVPVGKWGDDPEHMKDCYYEADHVLRAIAAAGYELVERELLANLIRGIIATHGCHNCAEGEAGVLFDYAELGEMLARLDS